MLKEFLEFSSFFLKCLAFSGLCFCPFVAVVFSLSSAQTIVAQAQLHFFHTSSSPQQVHRVRWRRVVYFMVATNNCFNYWIIYWSFSRLKYMFCWKKMDKIREPKCDVFVVHFIQPTVKNSIIFSLLSYIASHLRSWNPKGHIYF